MSRRLVALASLMAAACGDAAVDSGYQGEPLFELGVALNSDDGVDPSTLRFALRWVAADPTDADIIVDAPVVAGTATAFDIALYEGPPPRAMRLGGHPAGAGPPAGSAKGAYAVGQVIAYADLDGDHRFGECAPGVGRRLRAGLCGRLGKR